MLTQFEAAHSMLLPVSGKAPEWVHLLPVGRFAGMDGRGPYQVNDAQAVIDATLAYQSGVDLPFDYDHQIIWSRENGQPAPASGWCKELQARPDGIYARVDWTAQAAAHIASREYRYVSPVFLHTPDGTVLRLTCAALVNTPNLELTALASQLRPKGDSAVKTLEDFLKSLAAMFGLPPAGATAEAVAAHAQKLVEGLAGLAMAVGLPKELDLAKLAAHAQSQAQALAQSQAGLPKLAEALGVPAETDVVKLAAHAQTLVAHKNAPGQVMVPKDVLESMHSRLNALEGDRVGGLVEAAIKEGKIVPAQKEVMTAWASKDEKAFRDFIAVAPVVLAPGSSGPNGAPASGGDGLTQEEMAICTNMGIAPDDFKKTRDLQKGGK